VWWKRTSVPSAQITSSVARKWVASQLISERVSTVTLQGRSGRCSRIRHRERVRAESGSRSVMTAVSRVSSSISRPSG
jgi:hypothetical protein